MRRQVFATLAVACASTVTGCGYNISQADAPAAVEVDNCGEHYALPSAPQRVVLLKNTATQTLNHLGVLDRVVAKAGAFPAGYFDNELASRVESIPTLTDKVNAGGHLELSAEEAVAADADLIVGRTASITPQTVPGVPVVEEEAFCGGGSPRPNFIDVYDHVRFYGQLFDRTTEAENYIADLQKQVSQLPGRSEHPLRVAVVYPAGGTTYAYGGGSMATTVARYAGGTNVFADVGKRVFDVSMEELVHANPDVIVTVSSTEEGQSAAVDQVAGIPGIEATGAGARGQIHPMLLNHVDPPTPLAVDGAHQLASILQEAQS